MRFSIPFLLLCVFSNHVFAQSTDFDTFFNDLMQKADIPGISVAILDNQKITYLGALGVRSADTKLPVNEQTVFSAASLSKPIFAYAVLKLAETGQFDLDKPLYQYLPYADIEQDERYKQITARMALSHTAGFPNWRNNKLEIRFNPGERYSYSGEGFVYLQKVIEKVTGQPIDAWMQAQVFKPLGMTRTSYVWDTTFTADHAIPHDENLNTQSKYKPQDGNTAHSLQTTAKDYGTFVAHLLQMQPSPKSPLKKMFTPVMFVPREWNQPVEKHKSIAWGLGWGLETHKNGTYFFQWGDNGTFKAFVMANPTTGKGVVYLANNSNGLAIVEDVMQKVFGDAHDVGKWLDYAYYNSPAKQLYKRIIQQGFTKATADLLTPKGTFQDTFSFSPGAVSNLAYRLMQEKRLWEAQQILEITKRTFPANPNVYDTYAEASMYLGDRAAAQQAFQDLLKLNPDHKKATSVLQQLTQPLSGNVTFTLPGNGNAKLVALVGEFNDWNQWANLMRRQDGVWVAQLDLPPGKHSYKFVVDGVWLLDETNPETILNGENRNSVIEVKD